eukprot:g30222.t1
MDSDGISGRALRSCVNQLAEVFAEIFNLSLQQAKVATCFKKIIIIPVAKKTHATCLNDYCPVAVTYIIMTCLKTLVMPQVNSSLPICLVPPQFAYRCNRSQLCTQQLDPQLPDPQRIDNCTSFTKILSTGTLQDCILSPLLYSLYAHDCAAKFRTNAVYKFADDTIV